MSSICRRSSPVKSIVLAFVPLVLFFVTSCTKSTTIGNNILPASDQLNSNLTDTGTVLTSLKTVDSVITSNNNGNGNSYLLGSYNDPVFGMTKASFYTQVGLPGDAAYSFPSNVLLDSVVMYLPFLSGQVSYYGSLSPQTFTVDTLEKGMTFDSSYTSNANIIHSTKHIGQATITPNFNTIDTVKYAVKNDTIPIVFYPGVKVKLNKSFGQMIINAYYANPNNFQTSTSFASVLKGLYVSVSNPVQLPGQGGIFTINPAEQSGGGIVFYYRSVPSPGDTIPNPPTTFPTGLGAIFNHFDHDYSTTAFYGSGKDSIVSPNLLYAQAMSGVKVQISLPYLSNLRQKYPVLVNRAELDIPVDLGATGTDVVPGTMSLVRDSAGHELVLTDQYLGAPYYNPIYDPVNNQYVLAITRYVQAVLDGKLQNTGFYLIAGNSYSNANGLVMYGPVKGTSHPRLRMRIYCTPLLK